MPRAFIAIGSNIDPERNVLAALRLLRRRVQIIAVSTFYRTPAEGRPADPDFINGVALIETDLPPRALKLGVLREIEEALGRERTADGFAPRTMDLDLLVYDDLEDDALRLPDPDILRRPFLALPLLELDPALRLPRWGTGIREVAERLPAQGMVPLPEYTAAARAEAYQEGEGGTT
jgi:2-amino-4-hydroxy-6-hydroxymethyldihydropteridine diphosphokinase